MAHHFTKKKSRLQNAEKASVAAIVASNNENLFKLIASEKSHISQVNSATPDFNTVMKNYGTFSDKTWKATVADEKARVDAFTSLNDNPSESMQTDWDPETKLKREILASQAVEKQQNISADNLRQTLSGTGEEFNFTKQGEFQPKPVFEEKPTHVYHSNATQTGVDGVLRDAIGREMNQTWTNVGQESYIGQNTDELAFEAIEAIKNEEKAVTTEKIEYIDPHKYNRDGKGQIITNTPAHNQLHSEKTAAVVDHSISGNSQKVYAETLKLEKDTKELAIEAKKLADANELQAEKDATNARAQENLDWAAETLKQDKIKESASQRKDDVEDRIKKIEKEQAKKLENERLVADANANQEKNNFVYNAMNNQDSGQNTVLKNGIASGGSTTGSASDSSHSQYDIANNRFVEVTKQTEQDAINNTSIKDMTTTVREVEAEKEKKERKVVRTESYKSQTFMVNGQLVSEAEYLAHKDDPFGDKAAAKLAEMDAGIEAAYQDQLLHEQQINNPTADDIASRPLQQRGTGGKNRGTFRKLQKQKKDAKAKADAAESQSEMPSANGPTRRSSRGHRMKRGDANDPYHFTTLSYPPDAVNSQENGHFMLFYVNVQNKTKYEYNGYKNGNVVPVGGQVGTRIDAVPAQENIVGGAAIPAKTVYTNDARESGLITDVEYQKQMIRNGGKGNIIYNNQKVLQKGRKSPGQNLASKYPTTTRITDSVALYLPSGIGNSTSVSYGDFETGIAGYAVMSGIDFGKSIQEEDFVGAATQLFDKSKTLIKDAVKNLTLKGLETLGGGEGLVQNFDKIFGQTLNPYIEVAFQSTGMRTFDYTFKFAPKSRAETDEVKAIINLFRFHMLPEMKGTSSRYLTLPSTFDIHYMWQSGRTAAKENSFYNKIATCVLTNVSVDYTPNGEVQSFGDGAPTQISMSLQFKETEMMTKQHVNQGF